MMNVQRLAVAERGQRDFLTIGGLHFGSLHTHFDRHTELMSNFTSFVSQQGEVSGCGPS